VVMKPYPFWLLNHFTLPWATVASSLITDCAAVT